MFVAAEGLDDPGQSVVVDFGGDTPVAKDGPYGETRELFGGYFLLEVASKQEAVEWARRTTGARCPVVTGYRGGTTKGKSGPVSWGIPGRTRP
ncbi:YciI family protein [Frankia sp. AgB32]|nr:YciI family protein [Frankia sp. AgB32]MCK9894197.1 YciI family protein [Frankia sp. AgB32]